MVPQPGFHLPPSGRKEAIMAPRSISVSCPATVCTCGGSQKVTATAGKDRRTGRLTVTYSPCEALKAQGWTGKVASVEWADQ